MQNTAFRAGSRPIISVQHVGDDQFVVCRVSDPNLVLPRWIKSDVEITAGEAAALNREYGNDTVTY